MHGDWERVRRGKLCPICGKDSWCLVTKDGAVAICPRTSIGYDKDMGDAGYLFVLRKDRLNYPAPPLRRPEPKELPAAKIDWNWMVANCCDNLDPELAYRAAESLGIEFNTLDRMHMGQDGKDNLTFPMFDGSREPIGIRVRNMEGQKWAIKGSRNGIFIPKRLRESIGILICEGPTDTAAMLDLGFDAIGRASCNTGAEFCKPIVARREVVIVSDSDGPGVDGAEKLASELWQTARTVRIITPPYSKDAREWKRNGATKREVMAVINSVSLCGPKSK